MTYNMLPPDENTIMYWMQLYQSGVAPPSTWQESMDRLKGHQWSFMSEISDNHYAGGGGIIEMTNSPNKTPQGAPIPAIDYNPSPTIVRGDRSLKKVDVLDRNGTKVPVFFRHIPGTLDLALLKKGHSLFIRNAFQHWNVNVSTGEKEYQIHTHVPDMVIVPTTMASILAAHRSQAPEKTCAVCAKPCTQWCGKCKKVYYCSGACQTGHWNDHKAQCRVLVQTAKITEFDYNTVPTNRHPPRLM
ncbi:hypothetical protein BGZ83_002941 [Gryganskiella cystojenkinii]|nr:hypothetical protein BGZ83_002941 [Gryganskiella cystojenkinii]